MLIGPAIGMENMNPASKPAIDIVTILSNTKNYSAGQNVIKENTHKGYIPYFSQVSFFSHPKIQFTGSTSASKYYF